MGLILLPPYLLLIIPQISASINGSASDLISIIKNRLN